MIGPIKKFFKSDDTTEVVQEVDDVVMVGVRIGTANEGETKEIQEWVFKNEEDEVIHRKTIEVKWARGRIVCRLPEDDVPALVKAVNATGYIHLSQIKELTDYARVFKYDMQVMVPQGVEIDVDEDDVPMIRERDIIDPFHAEGWEMESREFVFGNPVLI